MKTLLCLTVVGYELEQLEQIVEEEVPLAPGPVGSYFGVAVMGLIVTVICVLIVSYMLTCMRYRKQIKLLDTSGKTYYGYRLERLRETLSELEYMKLSDTDEMY